MSIRCENTVLMCGGSEVLIPCNFAKFTTPLFHLHFIKNGCSFGGPPLSYLQRVSSDSFNKFVWKGRMVKVYQSIINMKI